MTESTLKLPAVLIESELERLAQISEPGKYRKKSHEITPLTRSMKILAEQDITVEMVEIFGLFAPGEWDWPDQSRKFNNQLRD